MRLITPDTISFSAKISEDELRERLALEVLEQIGGLDADGKRLPGIKSRVVRGQGRLGGYHIEITGPAPVRLALPKDE